MWLRLAKLREIDGRSSQSSTNARAATLKRPFVTLSRP